MGTEEDMDEMVGEEEKIVVEGEVLAEKEVVVEAKAEAEEVTDAMVIETVIKEDKDEFVGLGFSQR